MKKIKMESYYNLSNVKDVETLKNLFRVKKTEGEMMKARGYSLEYTYLIRTNQEETSRRYSNIEFVPTNLEWLQDPKTTLQTMLEVIKKENIFRSRIEFSGLYVNREEHQVLVFYLSSEENKAVSTKDIDIVNRFLQKAKNTLDMILIVKHGLASLTENFLKTQVVGRNIQTFRDVELAFNRVKHSLAPINIRHIPNTMVKEWAVKEGIQPEKLPMILQSDPIAKWYGAKKTDVFQMEIMGTETDTAGYYRIVR